MWLKLCVSVNSDCATYSVPSHISKRQFHAVVVVKALLKLVLLSQHGVVITANGKRI